MTLATTDSYCMGATVVARSLRHHGTTRSIVVMVTPNVSDRARLALGNIFDEVIIVDVMDSEDRLHLAMLGRPELGITFTKIHCWTLTQYSKCVFLDADTLVLSNVDELFERDELSAAPDPGWPDCFNSGVFVFRPSLHTHAMLLDHALEHGSFDGGDQGLLNSFFSSWPVENISRHLPFIYNLSASSFYTYLPAFQQFGHDAKIVHFLGSVKPWNLPRDGSRSHTLGKFVSLWWREYNSDTTSPAQDSKAPQIQEREAKMPVRENLDGSGSALAHVTPPSESLHSRSKPETVFNQVSVQLQQRAVNGEKAPVAQVQEPPVVKELEHSNDTGDTGHIHTIVELDPEQLEHRKMWENGRMDYLGRDAFLNIQKKLDLFLKV